MKSKYVFNRLFYHLVKRYKWQNHYFPYVVLRKSTHPFMNLVLKFNYYYINNIILIIIIILLLLLLLLLLSLLLLDDVYL